MSLIEGIGDEVLIFLGIMVILFILALAWVSTNVSDRHLVSVIVVDSRGFQRLLQRIGNLTARQMQIRTGAPGGQDAPEAAPDEPAQPVEAPPGDTEDNQDRTESSSNETAASAEAVTDSTDSELRNEAGASSVNNSVDNDISSDNLQASSASQEEEQPPSDSTDSVANESAVYTEPLTGNQLRQRRVAFFDKMQTGKTSVTTSESSSPQEQTEASSQDTTAVESDQPADSGSAENTGSGSEEATPPGGNGTSARVEEEQEQLEGHIRIRLKYLDERQRLVQAKPDDTIGEFKQRHFAVELAENTMVRFIFNGQELRRENNTLQSYNVIDNSVIHCLLSQSQPNTETHAPARGLDFDIGTLMFPLFGLVLLLIWYFRFTYRNYFNAMSTFSLIGITFLFIVALLASWRTHEAHEHDD